MFIHFLIILISLIILTNIIKSGLATIYKLHINKDIIKYLFNDSDEHFLKKNSSPSYLKDVIGNSIFYQDYTWNTKNNNYIYDTLLDKYYIIDRGYYYYLPDLIRYTLHIGKNNKIKILNSMNKVVFFKKIK